MDGSNSGWEPSTWKKRSFSSAPLLSWETLFGPIVKTYMQPLLHINFHSGINSGFLSFYAPWSSLGLWVPRNWMPSIESLVYAIESPRVCQMNFLMYELVPSQQYICTDRRRVGGKSYSRLSPEGQAVNLHMLYYCSGTLHQQNNHNLFLWVNLSSLVVKLTPDS